jgi:hypothetical protein
MLRPPQPRVLKRQPDQKQIAFNLLSLLTMVLLILFAMLGRWHRLQLPPELLGWENYLEQNISNYRLQKFRRLERRSGSFLTVKVFNPASLDFTARQMFQRYNPSRSLGIDSFQGAKQIETASGPHRISIAPPENAALFTSAGEVLVDSERQEPLGEWIGGGLAQHLDNAAWLDDVTVYVTGTLQARNMLTQELQEIPLLYRLRLDLSRQRYRLEKYAYPDPLPRRGRHYWLKQQPDIFLIEKES